MSGALFEFLRSFSPLYASEPLAPAMGLVERTPLFWLAEVFSFDNVARAAHALAVVNAALPIPLLGPIVGPVIGVLDFIAAVVLIATVTALLWCAIGLAVATVAVLLVAGLVVLGADLITSGAVQLRELAGQPWT